MKLDVEVSNGRTSKRTKSNVEISGTVIAFVILLNVLFPLTTFTIVEPPPPTLSKFTDDKEVLPFKSDKVPLSLRLSEVP